MKDSIVGRSKEKQILKQLYQSGSSEFLAVYGRRRVGKTFLIREFFRDDFAFYHTALSPIELKDQPELLLYAQLDAFYKSLCDWGCTNACAPKTWLEAFRLLRFLLETKSRKKRLVVFLDELPWLDTPRSGFITALEYFWNSWGAGKHNLFLIVCGSATTWMLDELIHNHGGLYGRLTWQMHICPFTLCECEAFFRSRGLTMPRYDIAQAYMILGGIPYYLSYFQKGKSLAQNIDALFFDSNAVLADEFDRLFLSLFGDNDRHRNVVMALSENHYGLTRAQIQDKTSLPGGGGLSQILKSLEESGFIQSYRPYGEPRTCYRLTDPFCLFYIHFVKKSKTTNPTFWNDNQNSQKLDSWKGLAFENVCFEHCDEIRSALGIIGVHSEVYPWHVSGLAGSKGAQIDMVFDRSDRVMNLCEIKFCRSEYMIDKQDDERNRNKIEALMRMTKGKMNIQLTVITSYGLRESPYSGMVQRLVLLDDLFKPKGVVHLRNIYSSEK